MTDDVAACAIWLPPGIAAGPVGVVEQLKVLPLLVQLCGFGRIKRVAAISGAMKEAHPHENHFYLYFMAVDPPFQGKGLGSAILDATLKRIDKTGMPAYLENSNTRNTRLYERAGFVAQKNISPEGAPPLMPMWRASIATSSRSGINAAFTTENSSRSRAQCRFVARSGGSPRCSDTSGVGVRADIA